MKQKLECLRWRLMFWFAVNEVIVKSVAVALTLFFLGMAGCYALTSFLPTFVSSCISGLYGFMFIYRIAPAIYTYVRVHRRVRWALLVSEDFMVRVTALVATRKLEEVFRK